MNSFRNSIHNITLVIDRIVLSWLFVGRNCWIRNGSLVSAYCSTSHHIAGRHLVSRSRQLGLPMGGQRREHRTTKISSHQFLGLAQGTVHQF